MDWTRWEKALLSVGSVACAFSGPQPHGCPSGRSADGHATALHGAMPHLATAHGVVARHPEEVVAELAGNSAPDPKAQRLAIV